MKENTNQTKNMVKGSFTGKVATFTKDLIMKMKGMDMERCILLTVQPTKAVG